MKNKAVVGQMLSCIMTFGAHAADFGGHLPIDDVSISLGETAVLLT